MSDYNFQKRLNQLLALDEIRVMKIIEIFQYTFVFLIISLLSTKLLNNLYFDHTKLEVNEDNKQCLLYKIRLFFQICIETCFLVVIFFYLRKIALLVPPITFGLSSKFRSFSTLEYVLHIALAFSYLELLPNYKNRFEVLYELID
jgi:hypothetical protein